MPVTVTPWRRWLAVAAVLAIMVGGALYLSTAKTPQDTPVPPLAHVQAPLVPATPPAALSPAVDVLAQTMATEPLEETPVPTSPPPEATPAKELPRPRRLRQEVKPQEPLTETLARIPPPYYGDMVKLKLEFPKPMFVGPPRNLNAPELERPITKRADIMVPADAVNLALHMPVSASDDEPIIGHLAQVTDGDKQGSDGSFVELGPGLQWIQIDLEEECAIYAVAVWHYFAQACVYEDVVLQCSDDPDFVTNVHTLFNNDKDNSTGLGVGNEEEYVETNKGRICDGQGVVSRYVRLYSDGNTTNDMNHYVEVEVWGVPAR